MRIFKEEEILDSAFRKKVILEINGNENVLRKTEAKKRYDLYKDLSKHYVLDVLNNESSDKNAVKEAVNRAASVSFAREVVEKKAMVYKEGVERIADNNDNYQSQIDMLISKLKLNKKMKQVNKFEELFKNAILMIVPYQVPEDINKWSLMLRVFQPYLYDVIEDSINNEIPRVYIFSYNRSFSGLRHKPEGEAGNREAAIIGTASGLANRGNHRDEIIADSPNDRNIEENHYIWWSTRFHFTTDSNGSIIEELSPEGIENPFGIIPIENFSQEQDGQFWAIGGNDIIEGDILINLLLTDLFYIAKYQGMGLAYLFGKGVTKNLKVGPSSFLSLDVEEGDPMPKVGFATSNPPIDLHLSMIKDYIGLLLSTNKLNPQSGEVSLSASGVHEMIKNSQNTNDIEDQQEMYRDGENSFFKKVIKVINTLIEKNIASKELLKIGKINEDIDLQIKFKDAKPTISEKEKLQNIEKRLELNLDSLVDAIKLDNPGITEKEANEKLRKNLETKLEISRQKLKDMGVFDAKQDNLQVKHDKPFNEKSDKQFNSVSKE